MLIWNSKRIILSQKHRAINFRSVHINKESNKNRYQGTTKLQQKTANWTKKRLKTVINMRHFVKNTLQTRKVIQ